jgi:hypothetical protein
VLEWLWVNAQMEYDHEYHLNIHTNTELLLLCNYILRQSLSRMVAGSGFEITRSSSGQESEGLTSTFLRLFNWFLAGENIILVPWRMKGVSIKIEESLKETCWNLSKRPDSKFHLQWSRKAILQRENNIFLSMDDFGIFQSEVEEKFDLINDVNRIVKEQLYESYFILLCLVSLYFVVNTHPYLH